MNKFLEKLNSATTKLYVKGQVAVADIEGSETTEKIGMVVVAVVLVGLLMAGMKAFMGGDDGIFATIGKNAKEHLNEIFGSATYGT